MGKTSKNKVPKITEEEYAEYLSALKEEPAESPAKPTEPPVAPKNAEH